MQRVVKAHTPLPADQLRFRALSGQEILSQLFEFNVELISPSYSLDFKALLGKPLTLEIETSDLMGAPRYINGQITRCVLVGRESTTSRHYIYRVTVRPWLWYLTQTSDSKIFQNKSVPDVIREVLADYPFAVEFKLTDTYRKWEYCVQYQETDFAFISRLMEHEGIYYWFQHAQDKHTLVLIDDVTQHPPLPGYESIPFFGPDRVAVPQREHISNWEVSEQITPGAFVTTDYNFHTPDAMLQTQRSNPGQYDNSSAEIYEWLGGYTDAGEGEHYTKVRLQDLQCRHQQIGGASNVRGMAPGHLFTLLNHPRQAENREYLVVGARYDVREGGYASGSGDAGLFDVAFTVLPSAVQFRAPRVTPSPHTHGPQTARVVGKQGQQIWTDNYGRVKVQFHWDRYGKRNENSSCWVRVSSPWASNGYGGIQTPRVDDEVVVDFIGGNPDRPLIIGRVYNAGNMPPWGLPGNATQSGFLTRTRDGTPHTANALMFEDKPGDEEIWIHAEKDQRIEVENDESHWVGHDRKKKIDRDETDRIGRNWKLDTGGFKYETVTLASVQNVGLGKMLNVGMAYNMNVLGLHLRNVGMTMSSTVGMDRHDRVVQSWDADVGHTYTVTVRGKAVGDAVKADNEKPRDISPMFPTPLPDYVESSTSNQLQMTDSGNTSLSGAKSSRLIGPGGTITIDESGIRLRGKGIYLEAPIITMTGGDAKPLVPVTEADCAECRKKSMSANPVDVATGQKVLISSDFELPGRVPIRWTRSYRSADQRSGALGVAWRLPFSTEVRVGPAGLVYFDADGRQLQFPMLEPGQEHFHPIEKYTLRRGEDADDSPVYAVRFGNGVEEHYAQHPRDLARWQLQRITTRHGHALDIAYTDSGALSEVRNNVHTVRCALDESDRIEEVYLHDSHQDGDIAEPLLLARYGYDAQGDLVTATDRQGRVWRYSYVQHLLTEYRTPGGAVHVSEWDGQSPQARCVRTYAYDPREEGAKAITRDMRFAYSPAARSTRVTDGLGRSTEYQYNGLWAVDRVTHPDGTMTQVHFDETGSVAGYTDELGRTTRAIKDEHGRPTTVIDPAGHLTRIDYNERGQAVQVTDAAGQVWQNSYDDAGHLVSETDPLGNTTSFTYADGLLSTRRDALGNVTTVQYTKAGQIASTTDCSGNTRRYAYDRLGQITEMTDAEGRTNRYVWNENGQMAAASMAGLGTWRVVYDAAGRAVTHVDPLGRQTQTSWNVYDQYTRMTDPAGGVTDFSYDATGGVIGLRNTKGETVSLAYDARGRMAEQTGFDGRRLTLRYNAAGELVERIDHGQDGQLATQLVYDTLGRLTELHSADGSRASYRFDERGLLVQAQAAAPGQPASQITYEYDAAGRRTAEVQSHHGRVWRLTHALNALGDRDSTLIPQVGALAWQRYGSGHVHGMLLNQNPLVEFERDALHREVLRTQGRAAHQWAYDDSGLLAAHDWLDLDAQGRASGTVHRWRSWQYDDAGQLTALTDAYRGEKRYQYDPLARLVGLARESADRTTRYDAFQYDSANNLLATASAAQARLLDMPQISQNQGDRLMELYSQRVDARVQYAYDGHGNRISRIEQPRIVAAPVLPALEDGGVSPEDAQASSTAVAAQPEASATRYRYDAAHQLVAIEHADGGRTEYRYDAMGRRIAKLHTPVGQAAQHTYFFWDGEWMAQEVRPGASPHDDKRITYIAHPDRFGPLARIVEGQTQYYVTDHLGTPQELHDEAGKLLWAADYAAYGQVERLIASKEDNPLRFPGQYFDAESGLHYNRYRYYDAEAGRYISQDPIGLKGGMNAYAYVAGNPAQRHDPMGLVTWDGTGYQVSYLAGTGTKYHLRSECIDGKRAIVDVMAGGVTEGPALRMGAQGFDVTFKDQLDHIDPNVFNGGYTEAGAALTFIKGIGIGSVGLGQAESSGLFTFYNRGYNASLGVSGGASKVTSAITEPCRPPCKDCENKSAEPVPQIPPGAMPPPPTIPPNYMNQMFGGF